MWVPPRATRARPSVVFHRRLSRGNTTQHRASRTRGTAIQGPSPWCRVQLVHDDEESNYPAHDEAGTAPFRPSIPTKDCSLPDGGVHRHPVLAVVRAPGSVTQERCGPACRGVARLLATRGLEHTGPGSGTRRTLCAQVNTKRSMATC